MRQQQESPVYLVEIVQTVETRGQKRKTDPVLQQTPSISTMEPETVKAVPRKEKEVRIVPKQILRKDEPVVIKPVIEERVTPVLYPTPVAETEREPRQLHSVPVQEIPVQKSLMDSDVRHINPVTEKNRLLPTAKDIEPRPKGSFGVAATSEPYDILKDLNELKPTISLKQLLAVAPECRAKLNAALIRKRNRVKEVHEVALNLDPGTPMVDVKIGGVLIPHAQVDGGSSVNLMTKETIELLGLTGLMPTKILLKMADQHPVRPLGILKNVMNEVAEYTYSVHYVVFHVPNALSSYAILLGRPWLFDVKVRDDWGKGTLTIGHGKNKQVLQMYPVAYHGESQLSMTENSWYYDSDKGEIDDETYQIVKQEHEEAKNKTELAFRSTGLGEYEINQSQTDNSDHAIAKWMQTCEVYNINVTETEMNESTSSEFYPMTESNLESIQFKKKEDLLKTIELGSMERSQTVTIYNGIEGTELKNWKTFLLKHKSVFAWTYYDLKGIPSSIGEHHIVLEPNAIPVR